MRFARALLSRVTTTITAGAPSSGSSSSSAGRLPREAMRLFSASGRQVTGADMLADWTAHTSSSSSSSSSLVGTNVAAAMAALVRADAVCFDVDSTVIPTEGIDVLAASLGQGEKVAALTAQAMEGDMKFQDALAARLFLLKPSRTQILECLRHHPVELTPGIEPLVHALHEQGTHVYLVSGGFRIMIEPVAERLQIPVHNIFANTILFDDDEDGTYAGFDVTEPTSQDMGKPRAVETIIKAQGYETVVMVGDGATDAQAKPPATSFIGFGGVVVRPAVQAQADWFVTDFMDLVHVLERYGD